MENVEIWKDIEGFEGLYKISNLSNIKNKRNYPITQIINNSGYFRVQLSKKCKIKFVYVHRLMAIHFIPNAENKPLVNHINGIKTDNRLENLEWCTYSENIIHAQNIGLKKYRTLGDSHMAKKVLSVLDNKIYNSITEASLSIGITPSSFWAILNGKRPNSNFNNKYKLISK